VLSIRLVLPGLLFGLVIAVGVRLAGGKRLAPALAAILAVMVGWACSQGLWDIAWHEFAEQAVPFRFVCGAIFGAVALLGLGLVRRSLRRFDIWLLSLLICGALWILTDWAEQYSGMPLASVRWVVRYALFAAWIGFWLP
jgi:hypothetical protein